MIAVQRSVRDLEAAWKILNQIQSKDPNPLGVIWSKAQLTREISESLSWEAVDGAVLLGFALIAPRAEAFELQLIAIDRSYQRQGVAERLLSEALSSIGNSKKFWLEVSAQNQPAIGLYEKLGFSQDGIRKRYYRDGSNAILMSRG